MTDSCMNLELNYNFELVRAEKLKRLIDANINVTYRKMSYLVNIEEFFIWVRSVEKDIDVKLYQDNDGKGVAIFQTYVILFSIKRVS